MFILLCLFVLGTLIGSFLNVCIYRLPRGESVAHPPSHCPRCNTRLQPLDLVPLWSQLLLHARCRYCKAPISWRYFGIEFLTGVLFVLAGIWAGPLGFDAENNLWFGDWGKLLQGLVFMATLVVVFWVDYDTRLIPLEAVFLLGFTGIARDFWLNIHNSSGGTWGGLWPGHTPLPAPLPSSLWAMVVVSAILWTLREGFSRLYGREALGFGDVILVGAIAANLTWNATLWTFAFTSVVFGASIGVLIQIPRAIRSHRWAKNRARKYLQRTLMPLDSENAIIEESTNREFWRARAEYWNRMAAGLSRRAFRRAMPFGPMLAIGAVIALLYGAQINAAYSHWVGFDSTTFANDGALFVH